MAAIPVENINAAREALEALGRTAQTQAGWKGIRSSLERLEHGLAADDNAEFCQGLGELEGGSVRLGRIRKVNPDEPVMEPPERVLTFRNRLIEDLKSRAEQQSPGGDRRR